MIDGIIFSVSFYIFIGMMLFSIARFQYLYGSQIDNMSEEDKNEELRSFGGIAMGLCIWGFLWPMMIRIKIN